MSVASDYEPEEEEPENVEEFKEKEVAVILPKTKRSLDEQICDASARRKAVDPEQVHREEQLSLF